MAALWPGVRLAVYTLGRNRGTTAAAVGTLALVIGANGAIFGLLNAVLLRPLPVPRPEQLTALQTSIADNINGEEPLSVPMFKELRRQQSAFSDLFVWNGGGVSNGRRSWASGWRSALREGRYCR